MDRREARIVALSRQDFSKIRRDNCFLYNNMEFIVVYNPEKDTIPNRVKKGGVGSSVQNRDSGLFF